MTRDEERREVAARLRVLSSHREVDKELVEDALGLYMGECIDGYDPVSVMELADLIEPEPGRTCRIKYAYAEGSERPHAACSECGGSLSHYDTVDEYGEESIEVCPYCSKCGAKVTGGADD